MTEYPCGCVNFMDLLWGVMRCHKKCDYHKEFVKNQPTGLAYYQMLGAVKDDGTPDPQGYVREINDALDPLPKAEAPWLDEEDDLVQPTAAEIGCGASPYVRMITEAGYKYVGLDPDPWAVEWVKKTYNEYVHCGTFPVKDFGIQQEKFLSLILCAHALEHMPDAPAALEEMFRITRPGGHLRIVVPDDTDKTNPDHLWFFTVESIVGVVKKVGFCDVFATERQIVPREKFIYLSARRPA